MLTIHYSNRRQCAESDLEIILEACKMTKKKKILECQECGANMGVIYTSQVLSRNTELICAACQKKHDLKPGDKVVMYGCAEAELEKYKGKIWTVTSEPWNLCGSQVVMLEGFRGGFATEFLKKV
jgi:ssDNA-binding Zn-finger/Zn-ribbon topoisomerase 1